MLSSKVASVSKHHIMKV